MQHPPWLGRDPLSSPLLGAEALTSCALSFMTPGALRPAAVSTPPSAARSVSSTASFFQSLAEGPQTCSAQQDRQGITNTSAQVTFLTL